MSGILKIASGPDHYTLFRQVCDRKQVIFWFWISGGDGSERETIKVKMIVSSYSGDKEPSYDLHKIKARLKEVVPPIGTQITADDLIEMGLVLESEWELKYTTYNNEGTAKRL